jgi:hypothetical protein
MTCKAPRWVKYQSFLPQEARKKGGLRSLEEEIDVPCWRRAKRVWRSMPMERTIWIARITKNTATRIFRRIPKVSMEVRES